mmetsp:Transcript_14733/g.30507  ORF Transcript_14733/g.30507 Transcript_14733/m.30507 type:complete len:260 (+) Transcript_14733:1181-1960(+)
MSKCWFQVSAARFISASKSWRIAARKRELSAFSCVRTLRSSSRALATCSICLPNWWSATSRTDRSWLTTWHILSALMSRSLQAASRAWVSRSIAAMTLSFWRPTSCLNSSSDLRQASFTACNCPVTPATSWEKAAIWSTTICHWNCVICSFFVSTSNFFCSISRSAATVGVTRIGWRPSRSTADNSESVRIGTPPASASCNPTELLIFSCPAKSWSSSVIDDKTVGGISKSCPHALTSTALVEGIAAPGTTIDDSPVRS